VTGIQGRFRLDNRRNEIRIWSTTGYTFLKRQSATNPLQWLALSKQTPAPSGLIAGQNRPHD
jgi:predicted transglutaminase-like cysteine proteinase